VRKDRHGHTPTLIAGYIGAPAPPEHLPADVADVWDELVPVLARANMLDGADMLLLEGLSVQVARARQARAIVDAEGLVCRGDRGNVVHPAVRVERDAWKEAVRIAGLFGMSPADRLRLGLSGLKALSLTEVLSEHLGG
jgi:P27 family predicted phage terminase small subunit